MEGSDGNQINQLKILKRARKKIYTGKNTSLLFLKFYSNLDTMYQAMGQAGETVLPATMVEDAYKNIQINAGYTSLIALIAAVRNQHPAIFHEFMMGVSTHISYSSIEDSAGSITNNCRKVAEISASDDKPLMLGGKNYSKWVNERGSVSVPNDLFINYGKDFRNAIINFNRKIQGGPPRKKFRPSRRDQNDSSLSVQVKEFRAELAEIRGGGDREEGNKETDEKEDNKGSTTGSQIGQRGSKR